MDPMVVIYGILVLALISFFLPMLIGMSKVDAGLVGWSDLADSYSCDKKCRGICWRCQGAWLHKELTRPYLLTVGVSAQGLYLSTFVPGHPPILIPWQDVYWEAREKGMAFRFKKAPKMSMELTHRLATRIMRASQTFKAT